jgi:hypothetical protein
LVDVAFKKRQLRCVEIAFKRLLRTRFAADKPQSTNTQG